MLNVQPKSWGKGGFSKKRTKIIKTKKQNHFADDQWKGNEDGEGRSHVLQHVSVCAHVQDYLMLIIRLILLLLDGGSQTQLKDDLTNPSYIKKNQLKMPDIRGIYGLSKL